DVDVLPRVVGAGEDVGVARGVGRGDIRAARIGGVDAGALIVFVPRFDVDAIERIAGGLHGVDLVPRVLVVRAAVALEDLAGVAHVLVPVPRLDLRGLHAVGVWGGEEILGIGLELDHRLIGPSGRGRVDRADRVNAVVEEP